MYTLLFLMYRRFVQEVSRDLYLVYGLDFPEFVHLSPNLRFGNHQ